MSLRERSYSILIVSAADSFTSAFANLLSETRYYPVRSVRVLALPNKFLQKEHLTLSSTLLYLTM